MKNRLLLFVNILVVTTFLSCEKSTTPTTPTPTTATLTMSQLSNLPQAGGDVTSVDFLDDATIVAVIDGKIATVPVSGGTPSILYSNAAFQTVVVGGAKEVYALTNDDLWVLDNIGTTPRKTTVFTRSGRTLNVLLSVGPNGQPYLRVYTYPSVMELWTSTDKGTTWTKITIPTAAEYGGGLAFGSSGQMYMSSPTSFYASADFGVTWTRFPAVLANYGGELVKRKNGDILYYVIGGGGLWSSKDNGASFTNITPFNTKPFYHKIIEGADGALYSLIASTGTATQVDKPLRLMRSTDGGATWTHMLFAQGHDFVMRNSLVVVGLGALGSGGVAISQDNGDSFISAGLKTVQTITSFGFDKDGKVIIAADKGLFVQNGSGWKTWGSLGFVTFATTPQGNIYIPGAAVMSGTNGTTWKDVVMPKYNYGGVGRILMPVVLGLKNGDAIVSMTTFRDDLIPNVHTNGALYRMTPDGAAQTIVVDGNFVQMIQDGSSKLWASTVNFASSRQSTDNGATWVEGTPARPGFVFDSKSRYVAYASGLTFSCGQLGSDATSTLTLNGFTSTSNAVTSALFDSHDHLYLLTADKGLFFSSGTLP